MKTTALLTVSVALTGEASALLGLRGHHLLSNEEIITPFESIAFIETFDEIPIFGGEELRAEMLSQASHAKDKHQFMGINYDAHAMANSLQQGIKKVSRTVGSHVHDFASLVTRGNTREQTVKQLLATGTH